MTTRVILSEYDQVFEALRQRGDALVTEIRELLLTDPALKIHSIAWRLKSRESLERKLARPDRNYAELWALTDLIGVRVITYFAEGVDRVGEIVEKHLPVDFARSTDKRRRQSTEFGYRSLH